MTTPSLNLSLTDRATWAAILSIVATVVLNVVHRDLAPWVAPASILAAAVVTGLVAHGKHQLAAAAIATPEAVLAAAVVLPASAPQAVRDGVAKAAAVAQGALDLIALYQHSPAAAPGGAVSVPVVLHAPAGATVAAPVP